MQYLGKALRGTFLLGLRQLCIQVVGAICGIVLAQLLTPAEFGLYAAVNFFMMILLAVGDLGLGASLIRSASAPAEKDCRRLFTFRQINDLVLLISIFFLAPALAEQYETSPWTFRCLPLAVLLSSFQLVPAVRLERSIRFGWLAMIEVLQYVLGSSTSIFMVYHGFGGLSFACGWIVWAITGAVLSNLVYPWKIGWAFDLRWAMEHLTFGLPFQAANFVQLAKDSLNPLFVGFFLGAAAVGYINFAQMLAALGASALMVLPRVFMPAFARLNETRVAEDVSRFFASALQLLNCLMAGPALLLLVFAPALTTILFGAKWLHALRLFYPMWAINVFAPQLVLCISLLNALGRSKTVLGFSFLFTAQTWLMGVFLIRSHGEQGYALAFLLAQASTVLVTLYVKSIIRVRVIRQCAPYWIVASLMGGMAYLAQISLPIHNMQVLAGAVALGLVFYSLLVLTFLSRPLFQAWGTLRDAFSRD